VVLLLSVAVLVTEEGISLVILTTVAVLSAENCRRKLKVNERSIYNLPWYQTLHELNKNQIMVMINRVIRFYLMITNLSKLCNNVIRCGKLVLNLEFSSIPQLLSPAVGMFITPWSLIRGFPK